MGGVGCNRGQCDDVFLGRGHGPHPNPSLRSTFKPAEMRSDATIDGDYSSGTSDHSYVPVLHFVDRSFRVRTPILPVPDLTVDIIWLVFYLEEQ